MTLGYNAAVVRRALEEVWSNGDLAAADEIFAVDFVSHQPGHPAQDVHGREVLKAFVREFHTAFPDFRDIVDEQVAEGDRVATRFTSAGTHDGTLLGIAPTHKRVSWTGIQIDRLVDGRIVENWACWDMMGLAQQLGVAGWPS